ncbi:hypothetical protein [Paludibacterium purpuratum]|uniref:Uncharacterized protein n=1 Tax=Paludibacterium purpuratum TaxID=1144873 RepID=A0A4R7AZG8_9NEIS|nr:hypothetical protein [Paludibacterium purpuratum]TDR72047.1 hypothetical protein DFP86_11755 [Paludibacterium purpuratum]
MSESPGELCHLSLTLGQLSTIKQNLLPGRAYSQRISLALALQLAQMKVERDYFDWVVDQLDFLEGLCVSSCVVASTQFKHAPLFPLWHAHYSTPSDIARNLRQNITGKQGARWLHSLINEVATQCGENPDVWPGVLAHRMVIDGYRHRTRQGESATIHEMPPGEPRGQGLTGEWIIYGKHQGENYYLSLATHAEAEPEQVADLYERLQGSCQAEFPFLFSADSGAG